MPYRLACHCFGFWMLLVAVPRWVAAQQSPFSVAQQAFVTADGRLNYLAPIQVLHARRAEFDQDPNGAYAQALATNASFVGQLKVPALPQAVATYRLVPAAPVLLPLARAASVVIINEAHDQPAHRAYCRQLLAQLAPLGYRYFAVEALDPDSAESLNARKFPLAGMGSLYACEPQMGNLLRAATEGGYYTFGHELKSIQERELADWRQRSNYRDSMQAMNVLTVLRAHPEAKLVVLVGYDHLLEQERDGLKRLATYLRELGHLDPLTIDQTQPYPAPGATQPQVLANAQGQPTTMGFNHGYVDIQVMHPQAPPRYGRPAWLATTAPVAETVPPAYAGQPVLAQLFDQAEYARYKERAIPLDQYLLPAAQRQVVLFPGCAGRKTRIKYQLASE